MSIADSSRITELYGRVHLLENRLEALAALVAPLCEDASPSQPSESPTLVVKRGPGRPPKVQAA